MTSELSPAMVADQRIIHRENVARGQAWSRRMRRPRCCESSTSRRACVSTLLYNAKEPLERYNMAVP